MTMGEPGEVASGKTKRRNKVEGGMGAVPAARGFNGRIAAVGERGPYRGCQENPGIGGRGNEMSFVTNCKRCGSFAINPHLHGRDPGEDLDLCDVCFWRKRAEEAVVKKNLTTERIPDVEDSAPFSI
jgi:hypothetical protein